MSIEMARRHQADVVFLSTSRVYPIAALRALPLVRKGERLSLSEGASSQGWSANGIAADFPLQGSRSIYGATKLAAELIIQEYEAMYGLRSVVNRCGILTGIWQMGKVDQGVVVLWAARHFFGGTLSYSGFGGEGLQVRDILHVSDLYTLLRNQLADIEHHQGKIYNVGGGLNGSVSLRELTELCVERSRNRIKIESSPETLASDIPWYVTDNKKITSATGWQPQLGIEAILDEIFDWLSQNRDQLRPLLG